MAETKRDDQKAAQAVALTELAERCRTSARVRGLPSKEQALELYRLLEDVAAQMDRAAELLVASR